jgi:FkbM family methyltransferase
MEVGKTIESIARRRRAVSLGRKVKKVYKSRVGMRMAAVIGEDASIEIITSGVISARFLRAFFERFGAEAWHSKSCLDVGAYVGTHTYVFASHFKQVIAFEPNPISRRLLEANVMLNNLANVRIEPVALGDENGERPFFINPENSGNSGLIEESLRHKLDLPRTVQVRRGDDYLAASPADAPIALIKIDVEGFETRVLTGLRDAVARHRPTIIFERVHGPDPIPVLREMGYVDFWAPHVVGRFLTRTLVFKSELRGARYKDVVAVPPAE